MYTEEPGISIYNPAFVARVNAKRRNAAMMAKLEREMHAEAEEVRRVMWERGIGAIGRQIISEVAKAHGLSILSVLHMSRKHSIVKARREAMYRARMARRGNPFSWPTIGRWFGCDHSGAIITAEKHATATGLPSVLQGASS
jgi:chromosomal replication initiation ATPase DnaA